MAGTPENARGCAFIRAPADEVVRTLLRVMRKVRPQVVATWAPDGGYGHPDHVAASRHATAAFDLAGQTPAPELGTPWAPTALYYAARPAGLRDEMRAALQARGQVAARPSPPDRRPATEALPISLA